AVSGGTDRSADTNDSGQLNLPGLLAGNYRLRFSGDAVITYEREVTLRAGQILDLDIALFAAPKAAPPPPAPAPAPAPVVAAPKPPTGPVGQLQSVSIVDLLEKELIRKEPRRESLLSCSGNTRTTMVQINEPLPTRVYEDADVSYYVLGGEGTMKMSNRESRIATSAFLSVPRGTAHSFERRGSRPLILLVVLGGEPCETAK
ncbi:MAG TPA: carboxypeptidase regulatory-like domain-containing protein, partial [Vicinamibacterales bacterium]